MPGIRTVETGVPRFSIHVLESSDSEMIFPTDAEATLSDRRKPQRPEPAVTCVGQTCESSSWSLGGVCHIALDSVASGERTKARSKS